MLLMLSHFEERMKGASQGAQLVCLGTGDTTLEDGLRWLEGTYKQQARGWVGFDVPFSHRLTAGADILLMPSRFEPCGLNQMYAMKYGTVPVAHATGGLRDTVKTYNEHQQDGTTGFAFEPCTSDALKSAIWDALKLYRWSSNTTDCLFHVATTCGLRVVAWR
jgi:starch synthase